MNLGGEDPRRELDATCHLLFTMIITSEQKRDIVFSEYVALLKTTKIHRSIATAFANAELAQKEIYKGFYERLLKNQQVI